MGVYKVRKSDYGQYARIVKYKANTKASSLVCLCIWQADGKPLNWMGWVELF